MRPQHPSPTRTRIIARALLVLLALVLILRLLGLSPYLAYGLAGGLLACLIVIGLDRLHSIERALDERGSPPHDDEPAR